MTPTLKKPKITKFLHLIGNKIDRFTESAPLFFGSYAAISYLTTFSMMEGSLSYRLLFSLPVGGAGAMVALMASIPVLVGMQKFFTQNSGESSLAASLNTNSYWMKKIKDLVQQVDHDCRIMPPEEKKVYAKRIEAKLFILKKDLIFHKINRYQDFNSKNSALMRTLYENLGLEVSDAYEIPSFNVRGELQDKKLLGYIQEELTAQNINVLDILYDIKLKSDLVSGSENGNSEVLLLLYKICLKQNNSQLVDTKEMLSLMGGIKKSGTLKEIVETTVNTVEFEHQIDIGMLSDFIKKNNFFSAAVCQEWMVKLREVKPDLSMSIAKEPQKNMALKNENSDENYESKSAKSIKSIKDVKGSPIDVEKQEVPEIFPRFLMRELNPEKIESCMNEIKLDAQSSKNLKEALLDLSGTLGSINSKSELVEIEDKMQLKVNIVKTLPLLLDGINKLNEWPQEVREQAASTIGNTLKLLQQKALPVENRIQNNFLNSLNVLERQHSSAATEFRSEPNRQKEERVLPVDQSSSPKTMKISR